MAAASIRSKSSLKEDGFSLQAESTKSLKRPWKSYIWDTWNKSPEERRFLRRLDACLLSYATLSYLSKCLDQQNITNAYVSGMQEDLGLSGNQLNYITTAWTCGYIVGQIPSNLLITRIRPSIWVPAMEVVWSVLTMLLSASKSFNHVLVLRFFIGLSESTFYPAIQYVIGSWYKADELGKRASIVCTASAIGPIFGGLLQAGAYDGLNNIRGLSGWRWLFIIDGIITIPIGLLGFLVMPDLPHNTKPSFWYTEKQLALARKRMDEIDRKPPTKYTKEKVLGFFKTWHFYTLVPLYILYTTGSGPITTMIFWLKSFNTPGNQVYTVGQINTYPLGINAVQFFATLVWAWWSDAMEKRWPPIIIAALWNMVVCFVLAFTPLYAHIARRWAFYYMTSVQGALSGLILAWANELTGDDNEKRAFVVASCNAFAYCFQAWLPILLFPQVEQPRVFKGNVTTGCLSLLIVAFTFTILYFQRRDARRKTLKRLDGEMASAE